MFYPPFTNNVTYMKRIVAMPGDMVKARNDVLLVNGEESEFSFQGTGTWGPFPISTDCVFVIGDNRYNASQILPLISPPQNIMKSLE